MEGLQIPRSLLFETSCLELLVQIDLLYYWIESQGGKREYPLVFVMHSNKTIGFIGNWERVQELLDADSIEEEVLKQHPEIVTLTRFFLYNSLEQTL